MPSSSSGEAVVVVAIPARYASTRLPGKPLLRLAGKPLIQHVWERVRRARAVTRVVVLTDDERIGAAVAELGGEWEMTPAECASGTDRIAWAARRWDAAAVINVQGDEPLVDPGAVERLAGHLREHRLDPMVTLAVPATEEDLADPNVVKVVLGRQGQALYFSRAPIPFRRHGEGVAPLRHVGIYGYQVPALLGLAALAPSPLEVTESLEQLRALENGIRIRVLEAAAAAPGVDTVADLARLEALLAEAVLPSGSDPPAVADDATKRGRRP